MSGVDTMARPESAGENADRLTRRRAARAVVAGLGYPAPDTAELLEVLSALGLADTEKCDASGRRLG